MVRFSGRRLGAAVLAGMLAAAPFAAPAQAQQGKTLRVALVTGIDHLNPFTAELLAATQVGRLNYEFLTLPSAEDTQPTGGIAESWKASDDKLTWTYTIRPNMKWSDGKPITAKDAAFTFNKMLTDETARTANGSYVTNFASVAATDDKTLVIKTKTPQATMTALDVPIVPEHIWAPITDLKDPKTDTMDVVGVGSGPYVLTEYKQNEYVKFKANKDYWRGAPKIDSLQLLKFNDAEAAVNALKQNEVDVINRLTPTQFDALKGQPGITTNEAPGRRYNEININFGTTTNANVPIGNGNPALKDIKLRKALVQAIDPQTIVDRVMSGHGKVGTGVVPAAFSAYHWTPAAGELGKFDLAAAGAALDAAGYAKGPDGVRTVPGGGKLELRLTGHSSRPFDQRTAEYVKGWFKDLGITVTPDLVSDEELNDRTSAGNYDLAIGGYSTSPDPDYALSLHTCAQRPNAEGKGGSTDTFFCDAEYEELYKQQLSEFDPAKRADIVKKAQARLASQAVNVVLDYDNVLEAYRSDNFSAFTKQPQPEGAILEQMGYWGYYGATPVAGQAGSSGDSGGGNTVLWIVIGAVVLIVLVGGGVVLAKRGKSADDRE
ncbi:peptide/nickel transport system substrate-binding protein [Amycolatopsis xylanica]|uniref:Peptide/nickel transport system substrate-binding protein n=1 Tax=Amycolatopsis xylanica TaxID=589385 RepID=A0A1H2VK87_9PSEU|nr:ABC transporter substrate-binding protein [Amycolatopsis xylanica]SDW68752.1 peptide/nickel transport system substrate-binding protein [Amycolatopsis xylanica]